MRFDVAAALAHNAVAKLNGGTLDPHEYFYEVGTIVRSVVPHDASGWMTLDPDTLLPSGTLETEKPSEMVRALWRNEVLQDDVHGLLDLSRMTTPVATLHGLDDDAIANSPRIQDVLRPAGLGDELRLMLRVGGTTWGHGAIYRELGGGDFTLEEWAFLTDIVGQVSEGLRISLARRPIVASELLVPGVAAFDVQGHIVSATSEATTMMALMPGDATSTLYAVAISAGHRGGAWARVRLTDGRWVLLQGGQMHGAPQDSAQVTVTLMPAPQSTLASILLRLHGLSVREREVADLLMQGRRTNEIAATLHISPHTLRDHVKAIFAKVGLNSRAELTALVTEHTGEGR